MNTRGVDEPLLTADKFVRDSLLACDLAHNTTFEPSRACYAHSVQQLSGVMF